jgi:hypothetical protein
MSYHMAGSLAVQVWPAAGRLKRCWAGGGEGGGGVGRGVEGLIAKLRPQIQCHHMRYSRQACKTAFQMAHGTVPAAAATAAAIGVFCYHLYTVAAAAGSAEAPIQ